MEIESNILEYIKKRFENVRKDFIFVNTGIVLTGDDLYGLLQHCSDFGISDIHIEGNKYIMGSYRNIIFPISKKRLSINEAAGLLKKVYDDNAIVRINEMEAIDTNYSIKIKKRNYRYRINAVGTTVGDNKTIQMTIRTQPDMPPEIVIIKKGHPLVAPKNMLPLEEEIWDFICPMQGLVIITGPTGSGKTTLLASCIRKILSLKDSNKKIIMYEAPIEYVFDKCSAPSSMISQTEIGTQLKSFNHGIEVGMRRKPNIIVVGEARDKETIESAIMAAQTGHLVYTTAHTNSAGSTVARMINVFPETERSAKLGDLINSLHLVVAQRLIRTIDGSLCAIKEYLIFDKKIKRRLRQTKIEMIESEIDQMIFNKKNRFIDDIYRRLLEERISDLDFKKHEKEFGKLNENDENIDDLFNIDESVIYVKKCDFIKNNYINNIHCGIITNKQSINYGSFVYASKESSTIKEFKNNNNIKYAETFSDKNGTNKSIILTLHELYKCKIKKILNKQ